MNEPKVVLKALIEEFDKRSTYVNEKIARGIEENRKGLFGICIKDEAGNPVVCSKVHINQISHEFKFGAPLFVLDQLDSNEKNEQYKKMFHKIFNYAVLPLYHRDVETQPGKYRFEKESEFVWRRPPLDTVRDYCRENDIRIKAHCLVYNSFNPKWFKELSYREMNINIEEYMEKISQRYKRDILDMDVINEMYTIYKNCYEGNGERNLPVADEQDHIAKMFTWAKNIFPIPDCFGMRAALKPSAMSVIKDPEADII